MSESRQKPRTGLAKLLLEADPDTPADELQELASNRARYECPACGWTAELRRNACYVCDYDESLVPIGGGGTER